MLHTVRFGALIGIAVALTVLFWGPLWFGSGFIGGDLYPYFFPQKAFFADRLHAGEFPLWNNLTGFGYPVLGESQTGAAYPPHLITYYLFDVNTAYNVEHLIHYVLCFVATGLFARRVGLSASGSLLMALVFTYGWFPPRACLEWAIVTGAWLPVALYCVESYIQTRWWRYAIGLSFALGLQLLAGHFHLAFITQIMVVTYAAWRMTRRRRLVGDDHLQNIGRHEQSQALVSGDSGLSAIKGLLSPSLRVLLASVAAGFLLASVQLLPAWELKTRSSRAVVGGEHDPSYGHLPPLYASQLFAPFWWYSPIYILEENWIRDVAEFGAPWHWFGPHHDLESAMQQTKFGALKTGTNKVEAHLYCGLVPLGLAAWWCLAGKRSRQSRLGAESSRSKSSKSHNAVPASQYSALPSGMFLSGESRFWMVVGVVALIYSTGWLLPIARYIPGFNFFRGPGRYGILTTWAIALLAARGLDALLERRESWGRRAMIGLVLWSTSSDLWLVSRMVTNVVMVSSPAINYREQSQVRKLLLSEPTAPRLYCPGQNVGTLLGVSCLPVYLGIAPQEYADDKFDGVGMPKPNDDGRPTLADDSFSAWLRSSGVTHILSFYPLDESSWRATLMWRGIDSMLNLAWGRREPVYLYRMEPDEAGVAPVRAGFADVLEGAKRETPAVAIVRMQHEANQIVVDVDSTDGGVLVLKELDFPGWSASISAPTGLESRQGFRMVSVPGGSHQIKWVYRPRSVWIGGMISLLTLFILATLGHVRFWHRDRLDRCLARLFQPRAPSVERPR